MPHDVVAVCVVLDYISGGLGDSDLAEHVGFAIIQNVGKPADGSGPAVGGKHVREHGVCESPYQCVVRPGGAVPCIPQGADHATAFPAEHSFQQIGPSHGSAVISGCRFIVEKACRAIDAEEHRKKVAVGKTGHVGRLKLRKYPAILPSVIPVDHQEASVVYRVNDILRIGIPCEAARGANSSGQSSPVTVPSWGVISCISVMVRGVAEIESLHVIALRHKLISNEFHGLYIGARRCSIL